VTLTNFVSSNLKLQANIRSDVSLLDVSHENKNHEDIINHFLMVTIGQFHPNGSPLLWSSRLNSYSATLLCRMYLIYTFPNLSISFWHLRVVWTMPLHILVPVCYRNKHWKIWSCTEIASVLQNLPCWGTFLKHRVITLWKRNHFKKCAVPLIAIFPVTSEISFFFF